jgi:hypothetical protein
LALRKPLTSVDIPAKHILQIAATIIAGLLILLTVSFITADFSSIEGKFANELRNVQQLHGRLTAFTAAVFTIVPLSISAMLTMRGNKKLGISFLYLGFGAIAGFVLIMYVFSNYIFYESSAELNQKLQEEIRTIKNPHYPSSSLPDNLYQDFKRRISFEYPSTWNRTSDD